MKLLKHHLRIKISVHQVQDQIQDREEEKALYETLARLKENLESRT